MSVSCTTNILYIMLTRCFTHKQCGKQSCSFCDVLIASCLLLCTFYYLMEVGASRLKVYISLARHTSVSLSL